MNGNRIRYLRNREGLSQEELADKLGCKARALGYWETGEREANWSMLKKMAEFFNCSVDFILGIVDEPNRIAPPALKEAGIDWLVVRDEFLASGLSQEQIKDILVLFKKIKQED